MVANTDRSLDGRVWGDGDVLAYINWPIFGIKYTTWFNPASFTNKYQVFIDKVNTFIQFSRNRAFFDKQHEILFYLGFIVFYDIPEIVDDGYMGVNYPYCAFQQFNDVLCEKCFVRYFFGIIPFEPGVNKGIVLDPKFFWAFQGNREGNNRA